jgi:transcriptional regulator with XRE-family HTH domain
VSARKAPVGGRVKRATVPFSAALLPLLEARGLSVNRLAEIVGVKQSHLSRAIRNADGKKVGGDLAAAVAVALDLADDYFQETREARLIDRLHSDPGLVDRFYSEL